MNRARSSIQILPGSDTLSAFRIERLLARLRHHAPGLAGLRVVDFYIVDAEGVTTDALRRLLGPGPDRLPAAATTLYVVPRLGTVSPWSSKATDIAHVCGLAVKRIELGRAVLVEKGGALPPAALDELHDRMTESVLDDAGALAHVFDAPPRRALRYVEVLKGGRAALEAANRDWGLALSAQEMDYLAQHYFAAGRDPTDAELMMFAQINSEHCRHKIFNAEFTLDGAKQQHSLFEMIKLSHRASPGGVLSAYSDNAAVIEGGATARFIRGPDHRWRAVEEPAHILMKVETHNHPTGISPHPGAGTGAGGEIRDEAATGRGARPKAGLCGFSVSHLRIPGFAQPWEFDDSRPATMATPLAIMTEGPIGAAAYNNEFGRPNLAGYFRTFETRNGSVRRGYHKPIMIAGGLGNVRPQHVQKLPVPAEAELVVLGGPAMLIGLCGGAASSMATGASSAELDFASVQRANPELERRCQEVVDWCWAQGDGNPILSIHDVGAGGLSNALPELVHADDRGGEIRLRSIVSADPSLSPMEIWCNEAQERYVIAVLPEHVPALEAACRRERCPIAVVGHATAERRLLVQDERDGSVAVDMPMPVLLGKAPRLHREARRAEGVAQPFDHRAVDIADAAARVLRFPSVASKSFLITIGDRTVGGLTVRDQMVGPWQAPVADCAVTAGGFAGVSGEAMAMGERTPLALLDAPASGRMAVGEAITNIAAARIDKLGDVKLSANWMAAAGHGDEDARLYDTVRAVGAELCPALGIAIPVGKDSLSMRAVWSASEQDAPAQKITQTAPLSLIVSAFAPATDVTRSLTPQLRLDAGATRLLLADLGAGRNRLGGSVLAQVHDALGDTPPDLDDPNLLKAAFAAVQQLNAQGVLLAYHDRSDGGLLAALCEMAFAGHCGIDVALDELGDDPVAALFTEELGMVLQVRDSDLAAARATLVAARVPVAELGAPNGSDAVRFGYRERVLLEEPRATLHKIWAETSFRIAAQRDNPDCAREEFESTGDPADAGLKVALTFDPAQTPAVLKARPRVAILREQGVNGQVEMAFAFHSAGFDAVDVHMTDLLEGRVALDEFRGVVACGGFSYGDVLGAGQGWAKSILFHERTRAAFAEFLARDDRFALGVCNGCQAFAALKDIVPGAAAWPAFRRNRSEQFEARWAQVEVLDSKSLFFSGMAGSRLPIAVAHGEGRAGFAHAGDLAALQGNRQVAMRFVDTDGRAASRYPRNPNGSPDGVTALCNDDGRVTILMPHPERTVRGTTGSWWPKRNGEFTPWIQMFRNARKWVR
jgi:phosphoribosylformylglycinamidine synthase